MFADYADLKTTIEAAGFFTTFQPIRHPGDRMVCASHAYTSGPREGSLGGNSFWVATRGGEWFIATWSPIIYRIPDPECLVNLCVRLLSRSPGRAYGDVDESVRTEFGLVEIQYEEFSAGGSG